jgi:hypothetical protein
MSNIWRGQLAVVIVLAAGAAASYAGGEGDGLVENPKYKFWASFKPGATSTYIQTTKYNGPEKANFPGGVETKTITYRLVSVTKESVVVVTTVLEEDFLSTVESAPTRITFPAKVKKANLQAFLQEWNAADGKDEVVKIAGTGREIMCKVKSGSHKVEGGTVEAKLCYSEGVPGGMVRHTRTTREGNTLVAETTSVLESFAEKTEKKKPQE